jgi:predicted DNA-binding transcriptional regulator AlpA
VRCANFRCVFLERLPNAGDSRKGKRMSKPSNHVTAPAPEPLLTTAQAAAVLGFHPSYLAKARLTGSGPPYLKIGGRSVRYRPRDLDAWLADKARVSTSEVK